MQAQALVSTQGSGSGTVLLSMETFRLRCRTIFVFPTNRRGTGLTVMGHPAPAPMVVECGMGYLVLALRQPGLQLIQLLLFLVRQRQPHRAILRRTLILPLL